MSIEAIAKRYFDISDHEDVTGALLLERLLEEYRRVSREQDAPQGAYQKIVLMCLGAELMYIVEEHEFDETQALEAETYFIEYVDEFCGQLLQITHERVKRKRRIERRFKAEVEDLIIARMFALLYDLRDNLEDYILEQMTS
jgi:hypothetical protein